MSQPITERDALLGFLAVQVHLVTGEALDALWQEGLRDRVPLGQLLLARGLLRPKELTGLEALVDGQVERNGNDTRKALATLHTLDAVRAPAGNPTQFKDPSAAEPAPGLAAGTLDILSRPAPSSDDSSLDKGPSGASIPSPRNLDAAGASRYRPLRPHAKGGLGEVFVALDGELNREVALKEIQAKHADNADSRARFLLEAEVTGRLEHPGIVPVYGLGVYANGRPYYAMRFIKGQSLQDAAEHFHADEQLRADPGKRSLELRQLLSRFVAVCNAIAYAHSKGVLHRDLKPDNVMLGNYGVTLVVDWGLAKAIDPVAAAKRTAGPPAVVRMPTAALQLSPETPSGLTQAGSVLGTPQYMSPEQAAGEREGLGPASDVYGLGATLYHLLTGKPPLAAGNVCTVLEMVCRGEFPPPREVDASVAPALEAVCLKAMALAPRDRYASAKDLADDVEHWLADEPVAAYEEPWWLRLARWYRRHPALVTGTAALVFTVAAALVVGTLLVSQEQGRTLEAERAKVTEQEGRAAAERAKVKEQENRALAQVNALLNANPQAVPSILEGLEPFRAQLRPRLRQERDRPEPVGFLPGGRGGSGRWQQHRTRAALALLADDPGQRAFLKQRLLAEDVEPEEMLLIRDLLPVAADQAKELWAEVDRRDPKDPGRFRALVALARFDARSPRWEKLGREVVGPLLASEPLHVGVWSRGLSGVRESLMAPLGEAFRDRGRPSEARLAADVLRDCAAERPAVLADLLTDADAQQFPLMLAALRRHGEQAISLLQTLASSGELPPALPAGGANRPPPAAVDKVEAAFGLVMEDFALCQALPLRDFASVAEALRPAGYRPTRFRPYLPAPSGPLVAAVWQRDGRDWQMEQGLSAARIKERDGHWRQKGYLPVDVGGWRTGQELTYGALWVKPAGKEEDARLEIGVASRDHPSALDAWKKKGYVPAGISAVVAANGQVLSSGVWSRSVAPPKDWNLEGDLKEADYRQKFGDLSRQPVDVHCHYLLSPSSSEGEGKKGERRYWLVRHVSATHEGTDLHGLGLEDHLRRGRELAAQGYRPVGLSVAVEADGKRVATAVWQRPMIGEQGRDRLGQRRATAAVALLHLGRPGRAWPLLQQSAHPDARTYFLHRAGPLGADVGHLLGRLTHEMDASARQALILSLGEYTAEQVPADLRKKWTVQFLDWYRDDPDPGVHAAIDWLLRHGKDGPLPRRLDWGQAKELQKIDADLASRERQPAMGAPGRRWYVDGQGQTMVLLGPGEFVMGSPVHEANRFDGELLHRRRIERRFALASKKVTVAQFQRFKKDHPAVNHTYTERFSPEADGPIISVTWYEAAQFCNWLSQQEGIPREQWCYPSFEALELAKKGKPVQLPADYLSRTGYRLPTEAEWEFACRAGAESSRWYGSTAEMLEHHAWFQRNVQDRTWPVGQKKPNAFGLFDMLGNTWDWCQEGHAPYPVGAQGEPAADKEDKRDVKDELDRMLRGGSFYSQPTGVRCAFRLNYRPSGRVVFIGFGLRVARTVPPASAPPR